jgi:hypothetical protein
MTVAIGAHFVGGMVLCADTNVVFGDGNVITGEKISAWEGVGGSYLIANAGKDAQAGTMLAAEILQCLAASTERFKIEPIVKHAMTEWHSGYTQVEPPETEFILAATAGLQYNRLFFCEPPNTVTCLGDPIAVGCGSRIVDPLLGGMLAGKCCLRPTILRIAYLMHRAKKGDIHLSGSETDLMVVSSSGEIRSVSRAEMKEAELLGPEIDFLLTHCCLAMLNGTDEDQGNFIETFKVAYLKCVQQASEFTFPSLNGFCI